MTKPTPFRELAETLRNLTDALRKYGLLSPINTLADRLSIHSADCAKAADESTDSVIGLHQMKALAADLSEAATQLRTAASEGGEAVGEIRMSRPSGELRWGDYNPELFVSWSGKMPPEGTKLYLAAPATNKSEIVAWQFTDRSGFRRISFERDKFGTDVRPLVYGDTHPPEVARDAGREVHELVDAAEEYATTYDGDERDCIKTDVLNAFFAGSQYEKQRAISGAAGDG